MRASKWLSSQILIDAQEMSALMSFLEPFYIFVTSCPTVKGKEQLSHKEFLSVYQTYVQALQEGHIPDEMQYRHVFSTIWTVSQDLIYTVPMGEDQQIIRISKPVIQLQAHRMNFSAIDGKFRSMTFGPDSITWGIQFSYPQIFQDNETKENFDVNISDAFPNTQLFQNLQKWVRNNTSPTPIIINDKQINIPMRLGKQCFSWINKHPQLSPKGLTIPPRRGKDAD